MTFREGNTLQLTIQESLAQFSPQQRGSIKDGPAPIVCCYNWTGPYIGAFAGMSWDREDWVTPFTAVIATHVNEGATTDAENRVTIELHKQRGAAANHSVQSKCGR